MAARLTRHVTSSRVCRAGPLPQFKLNPNLWKDIPSLESLLGISWKFYEVQRSGKLPADKKIPWRGDSFLQDGSAVTPPLDLQGGWYDAGDYLKITLPFATSVWRLGWSLLTYKEAYVGTRYENATNYQNGVRQMLWAAQYLQRIHPNATAPELVAQVPSLQASLSCLVAGQHHLACCCM